MRILRVMVVAGLLFALPALAVRGDVNRLLNGRAFTGWLPKKDALASSASFRGVRTLRPEQDTPLSSVSALNTSRAKSGSVDGQASLVAAGPGTAAIGGTGIGGTGIGGTGIGGTGIGGTGIGGTGIGGTGIGGTATDRAGPSPSRSKEPAGPDVDPSAGKRLRPAIYRPLADEEPALIRRVERSAPAPSSGAVASEENGSRGEADVLETIGRELRQLGATGYRMDRTPAGYHFVCSFPPTGAVGIARELESQSADRVEAMRDVLRQARDWGRSVSR